MTKNKTNKKTNESTNAFGEKENKRPDGFEDLSRKPSTDQTDRINKKKQPQVKEARSISEEPPYVFPSKIQIWCIACEKNFYYHKKNEKGEFVEDKLCPHTVLKRVER